MTRGEGDPGVIARHLALLDAAVTQLRTRENVTVESLEHDVELSWSVQHGLQLCAQNVLDVATHLAAAEGRDASDYASAIDQLAELGILGPDFARSLRALAGFRNVLVHGYLGVDLAVVQRVLSQHLDDFVTFAAAVRGWLAKRSE
jgi:uncharacterized protein YutE (UPF0331/DUF86 family)